MNATEDAIVSTILGTLSEKEECGKIKNRAISYAMQRDWNGQVGKMLRLYREVQDGKDRCFEGGSIKP